MDLKKFLIKRPPSGKKHFISANALYADSFKLAKKIYESGFIPDALIAVWRGGTPVGINIHEYFRYQKKDIKFHAAVRATSYRKIDQRGELEIEDLSPHLKHFTKNDKVLIVDDIFDTGKTIEKILEKIGIADNVPKNIKVAVVFWKPERNQTKITPDFYITKTNEWVVFPHELEGLSQLEIKGKLKMLGYRK